MTGTIRPALPAPEGFRTRYRSEPGMLGHYPWTYADQNRRRVDRPSCEYEDLYTADQMHAYAQAYADAAVAAERATIDRLRAALEISHPPLPVKMAECGVYCATAKGLIEEADRLRAAMREIAGSALALDPNYAIKVARAALGGGNANQT